MLSMREHSFGKVTSGITAASLFSMGEPDIADILKVSFHPYIPFETSKKCKNV